MPYSCQLLPILMPVGLAVRPSIFFFGNPLLESWAQGPGWAQESLRFCTRKKFWARAGPRNIYKLLYQEEMLGPGIVKVLYLGKKLWAQLGSKRNMKLVCDTTIFSWYKTLIISGPKAGPHNFFLVQNLNYFWARAGPNLGPGWAQPGTISKKKK